MTIYIFGSVESISDPTKELAVRVHDECNGSDVFGSDICTCRPYLAHGIEVCVETAQRGGYVACHIVELDSYGTSLTMLSEWQCRRDHLLP
jgi:GTP cyclohydrolase II